jgi:hypothetical protein
MGKKRQLEEEEVEPQQEEVEEEVTDKKSKKEKKDKKEKKPKKEVEEEEQAEESEKNATNVKRVAAAASKSAKPLPPGYVCNACGAKDDHAIYNCPLKLSKKAMEKTGSGDKDTKPANKKPKTANSESSSADGTDEKKKVFTVFLSGLPFDMNKQKLLDLITDIDDAGTTLNQRNLFIVHFDDNENRCRGLAYVNCPTKEEFDRTLKLNGQKVGRMNISAVESSGKQQATAQIGEKKKKGESRCYRCGGAHDPKTCTNPRICYRCKGTDHLSKDCPKKKN